VETTICHGEARILLQSDTFSTETTICHGIAQKLICHGVARKLQSVTV